MRRGGGHIERGGTVARTPINPHLLFIICRSHGVKAVSIMDNTTVQCTIRIRKFWASRIRIRQSEVWVRGSGSEFGSVPKCHVSGTLVQCTLYTLLSQGYFKLFLTSIDRQNRRKFLSFYLRFSPFIYVETSGFWLHVASVRCAHPAH